MPVVKKLLALILKLNTDPFPGFRGAFDSTFGFTVRKSGGDTLNHIPKVGGDHAKKKNDALLIDGGVLKSAKIQERPEIYALPLIPIRLLSAGRS